MTNRENLRVRMGLLLRTFYRIGSDLRCLVDKSEMPQSPAQVAQCGCANILAVLVLQRGVMLRVVKRSGLLEMRQCGGEFPFCQIRGAHDAMRNTEGRAVIVVFGLFKEFAGCFSLLGDLTSDIMARPYSVEDGQLL